MRVAALRFLVLLSLATCHSSAAEGGPPSSASPPSPSAPSSLVSARPFDLDVPPGYDAGRPAPLILALHGYGGAGDRMAARADLTDLAGQRGAFVARPSGTPDRLGKRFWNATDGCCNFEGAAVDDVAYLAAVVDDVAARFAIDPKRVWVVGFSNGGFMAHRLACDRPDKFAAIVSVAGATWNDPARCPARGARVSVLEVHSGGDPVVRYGGGASVSVGNGSPYPSVDATVAASAAADGCTGALSVLGTRSGFDAEPTVETEQARWTGCPAGVDVERWRFTERRHIPQLTRAWVDAALAWLAAHPKASP